MISFEKYFKEMEDAFENIQQDYLDFNCNLDEKHKKQLLGTIRKFDEKKTLFKTAVKNLFLGK